MNGKRSVFGPALLAAVGLAFAMLGPASARAPHLNVKLGLWEATTVAQTSGAPPVDTSNMTPEQRARVEAMMQNLKKNMSSPHTIKTCLTEEKLEKSLFDNRADRCKQTVVTSSSTDYDVKFECQDGDTGVTTGEWHFVAATPELVTGKVNIAMDRNGRTMTSTSTVTAKYIGAACGDVK